MPTKPPKLDFSTLFKKIGGFATSGSGADFWSSNPLPSSPSVPTSAAPTFNEILAGDPFYQAALASLNAQGISDKASRDAAIRQGVIRFGEVPAVDPNFLPPDLRGEISGILDPQTRALASTNTKEGLSILARLMDAAKQSNKRTVDVLGSRGMFRSGDTGYQLGRNQLASKQAQYDATNKFLDFIMGVQAAFTAAERARLDRLAAEKAAAAGRYDGGTGGGGGGDGGGGAHGGAAHDDPYGAGGTLAEIPYPQPAPDAQPWQPTLDFGEWLKDYIQPPQPNTKKFGGKTAMAQ